MPPFEPDSRRESEAELYRLLVENVRDHAVFLIGLDGRVASWNPGAERLLGWREEEIVGRSIDVFFTPEDRAAGVPARELRDAVEIGRGEDDRWLVRKGGARFWAAGSMTALRDESGATRGFAKILRDRTEWKLRDDAAREQLRLTAFAKDVTLALAQSDTLAEMLRRCADAIVVRLAVALARVWTLKGDERALELQATAGIDSLLDGPHGRTSVGQFKIATVAAEGRPYATDSLRDELAEDDRAWATRKGLESFAAFPLIVEDKVVGVVAVFARGALGPATLSALEAAAATIALGVERKRAEAARREQAATAETLNEIGQLLAKELDLQRLVQVVTDEGVRLCGARFGAFFYNVFDERGEAYTLYTLSGVPREAFERFPMPRSTELFGPTFRGEGIVRIDDVTTDPRYGKNPPYWGMPEGHLPVRSYLAAPVVARTGEVLGGLFFGHADAGVFTAAHERLLAGVAGQAAVAIDNARLYQRAQASAERLNLALSAAELGDWNWDAKTDVVTLSPRAAEIFGIPPGPHMTWTEMQGLLHPDDRERTRREVERVVAERALYDVDYRVTRPDGEIWVGALGRAAYDATGTVVGMFGVVQDVTERKRLEALLRTSEERLRLALDAGRMGVWDWNVRTGELKWSDSLEPLHGLAPGTFGGTFADFEKLIHPDDRAKVDAAIGRALQERGEFEVEFRNPHPGGAIHWIVGKGKVFCGDDGRPARMVGVGLDVTARKRAEETARFLADASAALAVLVDFESTLQKVASLAVPHFADWATVDLVDAEGSLRRVAVAHVDPAKVELAHELHRRYPPDPASPHGPWSVVRTGRSRLVGAITDAVLAEAIRDPEQRRIVRELGLSSYVSVPLRVRGKTLAVVTFIAAESRHRYDEGDLRTAEDLAARAAIAVENARLYRELRDADQRKDEFLATLAHELRNPLAPIRNGLNVLKLAGSENEIAAEARVMMERQLAQMVRLVDDLLDVSRITRNKLELRREPVELAAVVESALETSRPLIEQAGHRFSLELPATPVRLDADPVRLAQVFSNLLNNAAKYTEPGGKVALVAETIDGEVAVRVRDDGLGIPAEALPRVFEMFSQVDRHLERAQGGLGIGLTLVKRLVEMHGGSVEVRSDGPGRGSEFTVRLPIAEGEASVDGPARREAANGATSGRRVLIVDDNPDAAVSLDVLLRIMGNDTRVARDGLSAVEAAEEFRPEVILLDIGLPKLNGYEACRRIRTRPWSRETTIVALTGWGQAEDRRRSAEAGFDHHLVKPVDAAALESILGRPAVGSRP